ncbi:MAG: sulfoxide reductase heme-binding subunit YedZ [Gemmatimonadaceae bacterium]
MRVADLRALAARVPSVPSRIGKPVVFLVSLVPLALLYYFAATGRLGKEPITGAEHYTGEWTLRFLILTLAVTPVRRLLAWNGLAKYRRMLGLYAFFYASIHLATWVGVDMEFDAGDMWHDIVRHKYITMGMVAWLLLLPLALTSTRGWVRRLGGQGWIRLHRLTYAAACAGTIHYVWAVKKDLADPLLYAGVFAALLAYRVVAWRGRASGGPARDAARRAA